MKVFIVSVRNRWMLYNEECRGGFAIMDAINVLKLNRLSGFVQIRSVVLVQTVQSLLTRIGRNSDGEGHALRHLTCSKLS